MKDSILIDSGLPNRFWAEAMETANYMQNRLPTRSKTYSEMIPEEAWTGQQQDLLHICIFDSLTFCNILEEKREKYDHQRVWEEILIRYSPNISKHFPIWALQTKQVVIASKLYIDKSEKGVKLLVKWPLNETPSQKRKALAGDPRPRRWPQKIVLTHIPILLKNDKPTVVEQVLGKQLETAMSITEYSSKICKLLLYNQAINDLIHGRLWKETIEKELQNLENHQIREYNELPSGQKAIGSKWVFKVKYHPDGSVTRFKARLVAQGFSQV